MNPIPAYHPATAGAPVTERPTWRRVVDAPTRMFHWLFALSFVGAYLTAESERWRALHVTLGYTLAGLLMFRLLYGLFGPRQARLAPMLRRLAGVPAWLRTLAEAMRRGTLEGVNARQGQNLATALAVAMLLALALPLSVSGYGAYHDWADFLGGDWLEEVHEFFGEAMLAVVLAHIGLIAATSALRRANLALPMLTGHAPGAGPDLVQRNRAWLAALLLLTVLAFVGWDSWRAPEPQPPAKAWLQAKPQRHHEQRDD
jgi:cytochrome b